MRTEFDAKPDAEPADTPVWCARRTLLPYTVLGGSAAGVESARAL
ncbi:hypothetical protein [Pseudomonas sp. LFM046]|nr:hypothetical protein [Pseudomonas sp. LFM046]